MRFVVTLLALLVLPHDGGALSESVAHGTIVCFVPYKDGAMFVSESREIIANEGFCDGQPKVFTVKNHRHLMFSMTGNTSLISGKGGCESLLGNARVIDFRRSAITALESFNGPVTSEKFEMVKKSIQVAVEKELPRRPALVDSHLGVLTFMVVERANHKTTYRSFRVGSADHKETQISENIDWDLADTDTLTDKMQVYGGGSSCLGFALSPDGRKYLNQNAFENLNWARSKKISVQQVDREHAAQLGREMVLAAIRISDLLPKMNCHVGGEVKVFDLTDAGVKQLE
jgi:hypothetical protein